MKNYFFLILYENIYDLSKVTYIKVYMSCMGIKPTQKLLHTNAKPDDTLM